MNNSCALNWPLTLASSSSDSSVSTSDEEVAAFIRWSDCSCSASASSSQVSTCSRHFSYSLTTSSSCLLAFFVWPPPEDFWLELDDFLLSCWGTITSCCCC